MSAIEEAVIAKIRARAVAGQAKYGHTMERKDLSLVQWLKHAQEEALDFCVYLERAIEDAEKAVEMLAGSKPQAIAPVTPKPIDLRICKPGDNLRRRDGLVVKYNRSYTHETKYPHEVSSGNRNHYYTHDGMWDAESKDAWDIVEIIGQT